MSTIKQVAEYAGVSVTTVSHSLNHPDRVSEAMRERVYQAIQELGYSPNPNAQSLRTGRTNLLALVIPDICNSFYTELVKSIQSQVSGNGFDIVVYHTDVPGGISLTHIKEYLRQLNLGRFDGAIIAGEALFGSISVLAEMELSAVYIGHLDDPIIDHVNIDDFAAAYEATEYLIDKGHSRIAHISGELNFFSGQERRRGYEQALRDHGLPVTNNLVHTGTYLRPAGREGMRFLLEQEQPPTAVFIANAQMAFGALATINDMAKRVPDDIAVVAFDNLAEMEDVRPTLTTIDYNAGVVGHLATTLLLERLERGTEDPPRSISVPYSLLKRNSA